MKQTTIAAHLGHLRAALNWANKQELLARPPRFEMPKRAKGVTKLMRSRPITEKEFTEMLKAVAKVRKIDPAKWKRLLNGLWLSGLRLGEALSLSWSEGAAIWVDMSDRYPVLRIRAEGEKAHRDRVLPMTPDFGRFLMETPESERTGLVFGLHNLEGDAYDSKRASRVISAIGEKADILVNTTAGKYATAHDFRRAFGTRWAERVKPARLQQLMRHRTITTTMSYYVDLDAQEVAADLWANWDTSGTLGVFEPSEDRQDIKKILA